MAIDLSGVSDLEYTVLKMLIEGEKRHRESGVLLWLVGLNPQVLAVVRRSSLDETLGRERMHFTLEVAIDKYLATVATDRALTADKTPEEVVSGKFGFSGIEKPFRGSSELL